MLFLWLGLAAFAGFIAFRSFNDGSYFRAIFSSFWCCLFVLAIWVDYQQWSAATA